MSYHQMRKNNDVNIKDNKVNFGDAKTGDNVQYVEADKGGDAKAGQINAAVAGQNEVSISIDF